MRRRFPITEESIGANSTLLAKRVGGWEFRKPKFKIRNRMLMQPFPKLLRDRNTWPFQGSDAAKISSASFLLSTTCEMLNEAFLWHTGCTVDLRLGVCGVWRESR
jgi:hypothetical protein